MDVKEALSRDDNNFKRHPWEIARLEIIHEFYGNALQILSNKRNKRYTFVTLDMGCGDLFVTNFLAANYENHKFIGVDSAINFQTDGKIIERAVLPNIEIYSSLEYIQNCDSEIDIVLLCDVLEHIEDDVYFFKNITSNIIMKPDAVFIITAPAFQNLFSSHDIFLNHYRRYNHKQLLKIAYQAELKVIDYGYFFSSLLLPRLVQVIFERIFKTKLNKNHMGVSKWRGHDLIGLSVVRLMLSDYYFSKSMRKLGFCFWGLSCFMICQK